MYRWGVEDRSKFVENRHRRTFSGRGKVHCIQFSIEKMQEKHWEIPVFQWRDERRDGLGKESRGKKWKNQCKLLHLEFWPQVQFSSVTELCLTLCDPMNRSTLGLPVHHQLPESTQTHVHWVSDAIQPSHPLLSPSPPALDLSQHQGLFKWVALCIRWPKYWSVSFNISPTNEHPGLISFKMDWLDLLAVKGTLKGLLQHHSSKASILWCSAFFIVQLSHPYMTTGKTIALTRWIFVGKVISLLFNMLSRLVITFLPRSNCLLI